MKIRSKLNWVKHGENGYMYFFNMLKRKQARGNICRILDGNITINGQDCIKYLLTKFYKNLFTY